jgi:hypothetical protein
MHLHVPMNPACADLRIVLVFQPFANFPDCRNIALKVLSEGTVVVNTRFGHGIYHIVFTLIFVVVVVATTLSIARFNVCHLVVLVFEGYLGAARIVRCCV